MVLSSAANSFTKRTTSSGEGWGTGFLFVLFPEEDESTNSPSSTLLPPLCSPGTRRRRLIHKTQSTLSICGLLVFTTFLLFTLSTFEPAAAIRSRSSSSSSTVPRRLLLLQSSSSTTRISNYIFPRPTNHPPPPPPALQGMGTLHRRGTRAMSDLLVAHLSDEISDDKLRSFLRILHNTGILSRSDLVFLFPSRSSSSSRFSTIIPDENDSFLQLLHIANETTTQPNNINDLPSGLAKYFPSTKSTAAGEKTKEPIWGKKKPTTTAAGASNRTISNANATESDHVITVAVGPNYGSIVSFDTSELDPENTLSGFINPSSAVPIGLRRWASYPMLLGRVRRKYKHMALADVNDILILNDPFSQLKNRAPESVLLWTHTPPPPPQETTTAKHKRGSSSSSHHTHTHNNHPSPPAPAPITPGILVGGSRGIRKLTEAVLTEIVRTAISAGAGGTRNNNNHNGKKSKKGGKSASAVTEAGILNQLLRGGRVVKNVDFLIVNESEPIVEVGTTRGPAHVAVAVARWGNTTGAANDRGNLGTPGGFRATTSTTIVNQVSCSSPLQRAVYSDCLVTQQQQ